MPTGYRADVQEALGAAVKTALNPRSSAHTKIIDMINGFMSMSRQEMAKRYEDWNAVERNYWLSVDQKEIAAMQKKNIPTFDKSIIIPVTHFHVNSRVSNLMKLLFDRSPIFPLRARDSENEEAVKKLQMLMEYQHQISGIVEFAHNWLTSAELYGIGIRKTVWDFDRGVNDNVINDPFNTYPDVRESVVEPQHWEYVGFQYVRSWNELNRQPHYFNLAQIRKAAPKYIAEWNLATDRVFGLGRSVRDVITGSGTRFSSGRAIERDRGAFILHEIWARISPKDYFDADELKSLLGDLADDFDPEEPMIWCFTAGNGNTVIRAQPSYLPSNELPVGCISPTYDGLSLLPRGTAELMRPIQEIMSWLASSRMHNVYKMINEGGIIDPSRIETSDVEGGAVMWRIKREYAGSDVRTAYTPRSVTNVTASHWGDMQQFAQLLERLTAATETVQGVQQKKEQTLGEFETIFGQALGRITDTAKRYWGQDFYRWIGQMVGNTISFMPDAVKIRLTPDVERELNLRPNQGKPHDLQLTPAELQNVFIDIEPYDPRSLPNRVAEVQALQQMWIAISKDPQLRQEFDLGALTVILAEKLNVRGIERILRPQQPVNPLQELMLAGGRGGQRPVPSMGEPVGPANGQPGGIPMGVGQ